jgi:hypothetical protein
MCLWQASLNLFIGRLTWLAAMGMTFCAEIPDDVVDQIRRLGPNMIPGKESPNFPQKGQRAKSNYPGNWLSPVSKNVLLS